MQKKQNSPCDEIGFSNPQSHVAKFLAVNPTHSEKSTTLSVISVAPYTKPLTSCWRWHGWLWSLCVVSHTRQKRGGGQSRT